jgi:hypothetical protein
MKTRLRIVVFGLAAALAIPLAGTPARARAI